MAFGIRGLNDTPQSAPVTTPNDALKLVDPKSPGLDGSASQAMAPDSFSPGYAVDAYRAAIERIAAGPNAPEAVPDRVDQMSVADKVGSTARRGIAIAANDTGGAVGAYLKDPKNVALVLGGTAAVAGAQAIPGVDVAVDTTLGVTGAAMYAAAGPEHRANVTAALGKLKDYAREVGGAKNQGDLDKASHDFADFLKIGGKEAADALGVVAGAGAAGAKAGALAQKVASLGGFDAVVAAGSRGLGAAAHGVESAASGASRWLDAALRGPQTELAGIGRVEARTAPVSVRPLVGGARAPGAGRTSEVAAEAGADAPSAVLRGTDPKTLTGLRPHATYEFPEGYRYLTDGQGRVSEIHASLVPGAGERSASLQRAAGGLSRLSTDEGGHLIAVRFKGPAHEANTIAQDVKLNRGKWRSLENNWAKDLDQGKRIDVRIELTYPPGSARPSDLNVHYQVDGQDFRQAFSNEAR